MTNFKNFVVSIGVLAAAFVTIADELRKIRILAEKRFEKADRDKKDLQDQVVEMMKQQSKP